MDYKNSLDDGKTQATIVWYALEQVLKAWMDFANVERIR